MGNKDFTNLLPDMVAFVRVVETGSFTSAARLLGQSPSAVSRQVARLEQALGLKLLARTTRTLRLSESGQEAFLRCQEMMQAAQGVTEIAERYMSTPRGVVRLAMPKAFGRQLVWPRMPAFLAQYPEVDVRMLISDRVYDPVSDELDLVIRGTARPPPGLVARPLMAIHHLLCAAPGYLARHGTPEHPQELVAHSCLVLGETPDDSRLQLRRGDEAVSVRVRGRLAANHSEVRLDAARAGLGIACLPHFTAQAALEAGEVVRVLPEWTLLAQSYNGIAYLLYPPNRYQSPKVRVLIDYLTASFSSGEAACIPQTPVVCA